MFTDSDSSSESRQPPAVARFHWYDKAEFIAYATRKDTWNHTVEEAQNLWAQLVEGGKDGFDKATDEDTGETVLHLCLPVPRRQGLPRS